MPNPMLNEKVLDESRTGWAAPSPPSPGGTTWAAPNPAAAGGGAIPPGAVPGVAPMTDGPTTAWQGAMTVRGTINRTAILFALLLAAAVVGWRAVTVETEVVVTGSGAVEQSVLQFPMFATIGIFVGLACAIGVHFRPTWAKVLGPIYSLAFGFTVGAVSHAYESAFDGIVVQAAGATAAVFAVMLALYRTQIIKVTERFRRIVVGATLGIMVFYGVSLIMNLFGAEMPFLNEPSALGIGLSIFICAIAAMNLALDFDFIEKGSQMGLAKDFEWYAAFGLLITIVWLYLEIMRLLAKLQQR